ncbi:MAG: cytochrome c3 family protein [Acidobacteriia bacterium]|nr:cytochrome c3 family protein [Terriglobia bacterium]
MKKQSVMFVPPLAVALLLLAFHVAAPQAAPPQAAMQRVPDNPLKSAAPTQPLPYSHKTHVAMGLQCQFCHTNPDPGRLMMFAATSTCMKCHATVGKNKPAIRKLAEFAKSAKPIPWVRVYSVLPGVSWSHRQHLGAGMKCEMCHGAVSEMEAMAEVTSVTTMGVCIACHQQHNAKTACVTCHAWPR